MTKRYRVYKLDKNNMQIQTLPVVSQVHSIRIEHGCNLEDQVISEHFCDGMLAHKEINDT